MPHDPMAAALARLHAEHPHLPADGGPVWEPVQDDGDEIPPSTTLRQSIDDAIRPAMLIGLQDADLSGPGGTERIGEWADWIAQTAAAAAQQPADACEFHGPTGDPCDCGRDAGADCHPNPNGVTR